MRKTKTLDSIVPPARQRILVSMILQPDREWYASDLAAHLNVTPSSLQRDLARLTEGGILVRRRDGNRVYFKANPDSPILPELRQLLLKTAGLVDVLRDQLSPLGDKIRCAFVHGSVARSQEHSESDVDLIVIGTAGLSEVAPALRRGGQALGREVNLSVYPSEEFASKALSGHHFIRKVMERQKLFVIGTRNDLDQIIGRATRRRGANNETGNR